MAPRKTKASRTTEITSSIRIQFRNEYQKQAWDTIATNHITFLSGAAGTAKTFIATAYALDQLISGGYDQVFITRPTVEATGEKHGFLPGDISAKVHPYLQPIYDCMDDVLVDMDENGKLALRKKIHVLALGFARGRTMNRAVCILDEAQNATMEQLELWMTRMGTRAKLIITGDPNQADIRNSALTTVVNAFSDMSGIGVYKFPPEANVRHPLVMAMVERFNKLRQENVMGYAKLS